MRGRSKPAVWNVCAIMAPGDAVERRENPRLPDQISEFAFAPTNPFALRAGHDHELVIKQNFGTEILLEPQVEDRTDGEVDGALTKLTIDERDAVPGRQMEVHARMRLGDTIGDG